MEKFALMIKDSKNDSNCQGNQGFSESLRKIFFQYFSKNPDNPDSYSSFNCKEVLHGV